MFGSLASTSLMASQDRLQGIKLMKVPRYYGWPILQNALVEPATVGFLRAQVGNLVKVLLITFRPLSLSIGAVTIAFVIS